MLTVTANISVDTNVVDGNLLLDTNVVDRNVSFDTNCIERDVIICGTPIPDSVNYDTNLIAYYNLQNDTLDRTGNWNGTQEGGAMAYAPSIVGDGGVFNLSRNISLPINILLGQNQFTIALWAKSNNTTTEARIIELNDSGSSSPYIAIAINKNGISNDVEVYVYDGTPGSRTLLSSETVTNLNHFVITADLNNEYNVYINKVLKSTLSIGSPVQISAFGNRIGAGRIGFQAIDGTMDEIGIWSEIFDQAKVDDLYDQQLAGENVFA